MVRIFLIFILGAVAGGLAVWIFLRKSRKRHSHILKNMRMSEETKTETRETLTPKTLGLVERQAKEKEENKRSILGILETQSPLTNNHIEQLLGISDATATRYLEELEKEGRVRQVGKTGRYVYYERV